MSSRVSNFFYTLSKIFMNIYDRQENKRRYEEEKTLNESNFIRNYALQDRQNLLEGIASYQAMGNNAMASQLQASLADYDSIILEKDPAKRVQLYNDFRNRQASLSPGTVLNPNQIYQALPFAPTVTWPGEPLAGLPAQQPTLTPNLTGYGVVYPPELLQPPSGQPTTQVTSSDYLRSLASMQPTGAAPSLQYSGSTLNAPTIAANQQARAVNQPFGFQALAAAGPKLLEQQNIGRQEALSRELAALSRGDKTTGPTNYSEGFYERARSEGWMAPDGKNYDWAKVAASGFYTPEELQVIQKDSRSYLPSTKATEDGKLPQGVVLAFGQISDSLSSIRESYRDNNIPLPPQFSKASALLSTMFSKEAYDPAAVDAINQLIDEATITLQSKISAKEDENLRKARQLRSEEATLERHKQVGIELQLLRGSVAYKKRNLTAEEQKLIDSYNALGTAPDPQQFDAWLTQNAMALADANVFSETIAYERGFQRTMQATQATTNIQTAAQKEILTLESSLNSATTNEKDTKVWRDSTYGNLEKIIAQSERVMTGAAKDAFLPDLQTAQAALVELANVKTPDQQTAWRIKYSKLLATIEGKVAQQADVYTRTERQGDILFQQKVVTDGEAIKWSSDMRSEFSKLFRDFGAAGAEIPANILQAFAEAGAVKDMAGQTAWNNKWGKTFGEFSASVGKAVASYTLKSQKELEQFSADLRTGERVETFVTERLNQLLTLSAKGAEAGYVLTEEERRAISALNAVDSPAEWTEWKKRYPVAIASLYENVGKAIAEDGNKKLQRAEDFEKKMLDLKTLAEKDITSLRGLIGQSQAKLEDQLATARIKLQRSWQVEDIKSANDRDDAIRTIDWERKNLLIKDEREYEDRVRAVQNAFNLSMQKDAQLHAKEMAANDREFTGRQNEIGRAFSERMQDKQERFTKWQITTSRLREDAQRAEDRINKLADTQSERDFLVSREERNREYQTQRDLLMREWQIADESNRETFALMIKQLDQAYNDAKIAEDREWQKKMVGINLDAQKQYASFSKSLNSDTEVAAWQTKHFEMLSNRAIAAGRVGLPVPAIYKQAIEALSQVKDIAGQNAWVANYGVPMVTFAAQIGEAEKTYESDLESGQAAKNLAGNQLTRIDNALQSSPGITNDPIYNEAKTKLSAIISGPNNAAPAAMLNWMQQYGHIPLQVASAGLTARELSEQKISVLNNIQAITNNQVSRLKNALDGAAEAGASTANFQRDINEAIATAQQILTSTNADQATSLFKALDPKVTTLVTKVFELSGNTRRANDATLVASDRYWREEQAKLGRDHATMLQEKSQAFTASLQGASIDPIIDQLPYYLASVGKIGGEAGTGGNSIVSYKVVNGVVQDVELDLEALINDPKLKGAISESQATLLRDKKIAVLAGLVVSLQKYENIKRESAVTANADPVELYRYQVAPAASQRVNDLQKITNSYVSLGYQVPQEISSLSTAIGNLMLNPPTFENNAAIARLISSNPNLIATEMNKIAELNRVRQVIDSLDPSSSLWGQLNDKWQAAAAAGQPMRIDSSFTQMLGSLKNKAEIRSSLVAIANSSNPFSTMLEFKWVNPDGSVSSNMPDDVRQVLASGDIDPATRNRLLNPQSMIANNFREARVKFSNVLNSLGSEQVGFTQQFGNDIDRLEKIIPETASAKDTEDYNKLRSSLYSYWASSQLRDKNVTLLKNVLALSADSGISLSETEVNAILNSPDPAAAVGAMNRIVTESLKKAQTNTDLAGKVSALASFRKNVADPIKDYLFSIPDEKLSNEQKALREQIAQLTIIDYSNDEASNSVLSTALMAAQANPALAEAIAQVHKQNAELDKVQLDTLKANLVAVQGDELTVKSRQYEALVKTIDGSPGAFSYVTALKEQGLIDESQFESLARHHKTLAPLYAADLQQTQKDALLAVMDINKFYLPYTQTGKLIQPGTPEFKALRDKMVSDLWNAAGSIGLNREQTVSMQAYLGKALEAHVKAVIADAVGENAAEQRRIAEHNMRMAQGELSIRKGLLDIQAKQADLRRILAAGSVPKGQDLDTIRIIQSQYNTTINNYQDQISTLRAAQSAISLELKTSNCWISTSMLNKQDANCIKLDAELKKATDDLADIQAQTDRLVAEANSTVGRLLGVSFSIDQVNRNDKQVAASADAQAPYFLNALNKNAAAKAKLLALVGDYKETTQSLRAGNLTPAAKAKLDVSQMEKANAIREIGLQLQVADTDADRQDFLYWATTILPDVVKVQPKTQQPAAAPAGQSKPPAQGKPTGYAGPTNTKHPYYKAANDWKSILNSGQVLALMTVAGDKDALNAWISRQKPTLNGKLLTPDQAIAVASYYRDSINRLDWQALQQAK